VLRTKDGLALRPTTLRITHNGLIVTSGGGVRAAMQTTSVIPIVFGTANDPVGSGYVASLARPGGNVTGLSNQAPDLAGKRLKILREVVPGLRRLAVMGNSSLPAIVLEMGEFKHSPVRSASMRPALKFGACRILRPPSRLSRIERTHCTSRATVGNQIRINAFALAARLPTMSTIRDQIEAGGLMSYGPNIPDQFRRAAEYVDKILRGAKPGDIPVEQPTKFDLAINLITARALGLTIPEKLLAIANEVIE
jgi:putative tryptophan/tyrosine transport system substrate-binding protein